MNVDLRVCLLYAKAVYISKSMWQHPPKFSRKIILLLRLCQHKKNVKKRRTCELCRTSGHRQFQVTFRMLGSGPGKKRPVSQCVLDPVFLPLPATPTPAAGGRVLIGPAGPLARAPIQGLRLGVRGYIGDACGPGTAAAAATYFSPAVVPPAAAPSPGDSARQAESLTQKYPRPRHAQKILAAHWHQ